MLRMTLALSALMMSATPGMAWSFWDFLCWRGCSTGGGNPQPTPVPEISAVGGLAAATAVLCLLLLVRERRRRRA